MKPDISTHINARKKELGGIAGKRLRNARLDALRRLEETGLPNNRMESWKYSRIGKVLNGLSITVEPYKDSLKEARSALKKTNYELCSLAEAIAANHNLVNLHLAKYAGCQNGGLTALNTAFFSDGVFLNIPDNTVVGEPIFLPLSRSAAVKGMVHPRNLIIIGNNSSVTIVSDKQTEVSVDNSLSNTVEEIVMGEHADVHHYCLQDSPLSEVNSSFATLKKNARYTRVTATLEGGFIRNNVNVCLGDSGCEANLYGYYHITEKNQVDNHTVIEHKMPDCSSNELYVGLLDDEASGIFNGRVLVAQDAQRTNAFQSNKNILLSDNATMNTKPELEIYADDVKCSHGATIGQVDPESLFYLRSRGIPRQLAMSMLLQGFSTEITGKIRDERFKDKIAELILRKLNSL